MPSNILVITDHSEYSYYSLERNDPIKRSLQSLGVPHKVISFNEFCELFSAPLSVEVNWEFVRFVSLHGYTHIFLPSEFFRYCSVATILALKDSGVLIAGVMGDDENNFIINHAYLGIFSHPVAYHHKQFKCYKKLASDSLLLPIGADFENCISFDAEIKHDAVFVGAPYGVRPSLINQLIDSGIDVMVYGAADWSRLVPCENYGGLVPNEDYFSVLASGACVLGFCESWQHTEIIHLNSKPFDSVKAGRPLVMTSFDEFCLEYNVRPGEDFLTYKSPEELIISVKRILRNPAFAAALTRNLRNKLVENYDYKVLYQNFFQKFLAADSFCDNRAKVSYISSRGYSMDDAPDFLIPGKPKSLAEKRTLESILYGFIGSKIPITVESIYNGMLVKKYFGLIDSGSIAYPLEEGEFSTKPYIPWPVRFVGSRVRVRVPATSSQSWFARFVLWAEVLSKAVKGLKSRGI